MATLAPCSAKRTAIACPIPEVPPVTRTFLPFRPGIPARRSLGSTAVWDIDSPRWTVLDWLGHGRPASEHRTASSAAPNTTCEVSSHATAAGASRHGGRWIPSAGRAEPWLPA